MTFGDNAAIPKLSPAFTYVNAFIYLYSNVMNDIIQVASRKEDNPMYEVMQEQVTNGSRVIAEIQNAAYMATMWEDEGGAYHDSGWNQSWPDGWRDSHG